MKIGAPLIGFVSGSTVSTLARLAPALALILAACGGATPAASGGPPAAGGTGAVGQVSTKLADGPLPALPALPLYVNVLDVRQPSASPLQHAHVAGFVYVVTGGHRVVVMPEGVSKEADAGGALFVPQDVVHTHSNPRSETGEWYFIALRNTSARTAAPSFPGQTTLYESADLPANALAAGKHVEQLNLVTLDKGGRTASHKHGGVEMLVVLDGTVQLRVRGQEPQMLAKGKGAVVPPNTILQATNAGDGQARFIAFFVTPEGADFSTNVDTVP